ncbi:MAG: threonine/serine exporter family protein, partial [bacterium]|nr:threonine/serine exporter family protein [bacterium]
MDNSNLLLKLGLHCGELMLQSGAEVYRVEDSVTRLLTQAGAVDPQIIVTPTGLYLS